MKLNPKQHMITPQKQVVTSATISSQINGIKNALKQPQLYTDDELRILKKITT